MKYLIIKPIIFSLFIHLKPFRNVLLYTEYNCIQTTTIHFFNYLSTLPSNFTHTMSTIKTFPPIF